MYISVAHADTVEVLGELLRHTLGEGGDQHSLIGAHTFIDLFEHIVDGVIHLTHNDFRVEEACGTYELLDDGALTLLQLIVGRGGAHIDGLSGELLELREGEGAVVDSGRQAEAILHKGLLTGTVAAIHRAYLGYGDVALVDDQEVVLGEVVEQAEGALTGLAAIEVARVVLDTRAVAELLYHLQVVLHALLNALSLNTSALLLVVGDAVAEVELYLLYRLIGAVASGDKEVGGEYLHALHLLHTLTGCGVDAEDGLHLVAKHHNTIGNIGVGGHNVDSVAHHTERGGGELLLGAGVERIDQRVDKSLMANTFAALDEYAVGAEIFGVADTVEARHTRHHNHIAATREERGGGAQSQLLDILVDGEVLLDVGVAGGEVGLGLVVVVVGYEVLHRVVGEEGLKLAI